ncbi:MAG: hypothetical protein JO244_09475, partial [Solirubrobacterales bacterium]|nr:hypothetical protein [Solirubrobacterales bacterium]
MSATHTIDHTATRASGQGQTRAWADRDRVLDWLAVGLPALLGLGLCLYELTTRS